MILEAMDVSLVVLRTKDFAVLREHGALGIAALRESRYVHGKLFPERAQSWLVARPPDLLLQQFWSHERHQFEAADEEEARALLLYIQRLFDERDMN